MGDLFAGFADEGQSIPALRQNLDRLGVASPRGHRLWSTSDPHSMLTNPTYIGQVFASRVRRRPAGRHRSALLPVGCGGMGATRAVDAAEWIAVGPVPAIISQAQFDRTQERLAYNCQMARRNNQVHPYLLHGLVRPVSPMLRPLHAGRVCRPYVPDQATIGDAKPISIRR